MHACVYSMKIKFAFRKCTLLVDLKYDFYFFFPKEFLLTQVNCSVCSLGHFSQKAKYPLGYSPSCSLADSGVLQWMSLEDILVFI